MEEVSELVGWCRLRGCYVDLMAVVVARGRETGFLKVVVTACTHMQSCSLRLKPGCLVGRHFIIEA